MIKYEKRREVGKRKISRKRKRNYEGRRKRRKRKDNRKKSGREKNLFPPLENSFLFFSFLKTSNLYFILIQK